MKPYGLSRKFKECMCYHCAPTQYSKSTERHFGKKEIEEQVSEYIGYCKKHSERIINDQGHCSKCNIINFQGGLNIYLEEV